MVEFQCRRNAEFRRHWEAECRMPMAFQKPGILPCIVRTLYKIKLKLDFFQSTFCSDVMSASGESVASNDYCGDDAVGYMEVCEDGDYNYILASGAPDHEAEYDQDNPNPNTRCERWQFVKAPSTWEDSGSTSTKMGVTGYIFSGGTTYDHRSGDQDDAPLAIYWEGDSLDPYYGHSDQDSQYHYHATPDGWSSAGDASACEHIGYMIDGGKLYGLCEIDGVELTSCYNLDSSLTDSADADYESDYTFESTDDCHLDECNMYQMNGEMVYVMSSAYPYVPPCLKGTVADIEGFTPSVRP